MLSIIGQAIFEYFILTIVMAGIVLYFLNNRHFQSIKESCEEAFNDAVEEMLE